MTDFEMLENKRVLNHALAQQRLEGLSVSSKTETDLTRVANGEIPLSIVINELYARYAHVEVLQR
ncbi:MAG: antitoxin VbhA family protein [Bdellovibrionales bacterium]